MDGQGLPHRGRPAPALDHDLGALLSSTGHGDEAAFSRLYDLVAARVYGLVRRVVRDGGEAEHVSGEVFVEIWRTASRFRPGSGALAWVLAVAHRHAVTHVRSTRGAAAPVRPLLAPQDGHGADEALGLSYYDAYAVTDLAGALGVSVDVAHDRLRTALASLRVQPSAS